MGPVEAWARAPVFDVLVQVNRIERFFKYLKQRTRRFYNNMNM